MTIKRRNHSEMKAFRAESLFRNYPYQTSVIIQAANQYISVSSEIDVGSVYRSYADQLGILEWLCYVPAAYEAEFNEHPFQLTFVHRTTLSCIESTAISIHHGILLRYSRLSFKRPTQQRKKGIPRQTASHKPSSSAHIAFGGRQR
jgi:hypothetical protein